MEVEYMKYVKAIGVLFVSIICLTMISTQATAHSPGFMNLKYSENDLRVIIFHFSLSPFRSHYVYRIEIEINGELILEENYDTQPRFFFLKYNFEITAEPGDEITVTAYCSLFGQKTKTITLN